MKKWLLSGLVSLALLGGCKTVSYVPENKGNEMNPTVNLHSMYFKVSDVFPSEQGYQLFDVRQNGATIIYAASSPNDSIPNFVKVVDSPYRSTNTTYYLNSELYVNAIPLDDLLAKSLIEDFRTKKSELDSANAVLEKERSLERK
ncbi:MAG: hypothetical protein ACP5N3_04535 [Candidatus Nanoarchaeia archaeon]